MVLYRDLDDRTRNRSNRNSRGVTWGVDNSPDRSQEADLVDAVMSRVISSCECENSIPKTRAAANYSYYLLLYIRYSLQRREDEPTVMLAPLYSQLCDTSSSKTADEAP
jgi:hypothetical protein